MIVVCFVVNVKGLVNPKRKLFVAQLLDLTCENEIRSAQEIKFVLMHGDGVQGAREKIFQFDHFGLLRLDGFLVLD